MALWMLPPPHPHPQKKKREIQYVFPIKQLINFCSPHWKVPKWEWNWKKPQENKTYEKSVNNWQYCWVRRRLLWTEQFWLPDVSFRMWGKEEFCHYVLCSHKYEILILQFSTCRKIPMQNIRTFRSLCVITRCKTHPTTFIFQIMD